MNQRTAQLRVMAKRFKRSIPQMMALPLPDELIDQLSDGEAPEFLAILRSLGMSQNERYHWQREGEPNDPDTGSPYHAH